MCQLAIINQGIIIAQLEFSLKNETMLPVIAPPIMAALIGAGTSLFNNVMSGANQRSMLKYNHPVNQVRRVRQAGLPYAALNEKSAGNQSTPTQVDGSGFQEAGRQIGQYQTYKKEIEATKEIQERIKTLELQNKKLEGELQWYLSGAGTDPSRTNLTSMLAMEQSYKGAQNVGMNYANEIAKLNAGNRPTELILNNAEQSQRIRNSLKAMEGVDLDNALKKIELEYKPRMKTAELEGMIARNGLTVTEGGIKALELALKAHTFDNDVTMSDINRLSAEIAYDVLGRNAEFTKEYQEFAKKMRDLFSVDGQRSMTLKQRLDAVGALIYTTLSGVSGSTSPGNIINHIK